MVLSYKRALCFAFLFFGCTDFERDNPDDEKAINYNPSPVGIYDSSSSFLPGGLVFCGFYSGGCAEISAEACSAIGGEVVAFCPVSSSSSSIPSSSSVVVVYGSSVTYGGETYQTVVIGTQTWFACNLNYAPSSGTFISCDTYDCAAYGRLYDWSTAMNLPSSCNSNSCFNQIQSPHRGICPSGWHIPGYDEWSTLSDYVERNSGCSSCDAKKLKATSGWYNNGNGTDDYGFSALPGGYGNSGGSFNNVGDLGYWWSASENVNGSLDAYNRDMHYGGDYAGWYNNGKSFLLSVRCVQD